MNSNDSNDVKNRGEILFLYDVVNGNPNGDPIDENKPRIDEETGINIVTDVRLKRTIRDYLHNYKGEEIFILEVRDEGGKGENNKEKKEELLKEYIDVRLFGVTNAFKNNVITLTGPVQFKFGRSLHKVNMQYIKGTTVIPSKEGKKQGTFTEKYILPYSLIAFYGVVNEIAAEKQKIPLTKSDVEDMLDAMWNGTKNLMSTSKMEQIPRLLVYIEHKEKYYHIGELDKRIKLVSDKNDEEIRDTSDYKLDITELINAIKNRKDKISKVKYIFDERTEFVKEGSLIDIKKALNEVLSDDCMEELQF